MCACRREVAEQLRQQQTAAEDERRQSDKDKASLLMQKYVSLRQEMLEYSRYYKSHVRYAFTLLPVIVAFIALIGARSSDLPIAASRGFWFFTAISITTVIGYLAFDALESQFALIALASRAGVLEQLINEYISESLFGWETRLADEFWGSEKSPIKDVSHPSRYLLLYAALMAGLAMLAVPIYYAYHFWENPRYVAHVLVGQYAIASTILYSAATLTLILWVGYGVLRRMRGPARDFSLEISQKLRGRSIGPIH